MSKSPMQICVVAQGYTPDACMTDPMTALQSIRMQAMWNAYRSTFSASGQAGAGDFATLPPLRSGLPWYRNSACAPSAAVHLWSMV